MKVGDLVELVWLDDFYRDYDLSDFLGIVTGFDSTNCAYVQYHNKTDKFPVAIAIPKDRLKVIE